MDWPQYFDGKGWQNDLSTKHNISSIPAHFPHWQGWQDRRLQFAAGIALDTELAKLLD